MSRHAGLSFLLLFLFKTITAFQHRQTTTIVPGSKEQNMLFPIKEDKMWTKPGQQKQNIEELHRQSNSNELINQPKHSVFDNTTQIRRGNITCWKVNCTKDHFVKSCDEDDGNDTCVRCPDGTFLNDNTSSMEYNHECRPKTDCFPEATRSLYPYFCGKVRTFCKCDITRSYCGHDPCKCRSGHCSSFSAPVLTINCGCDRLTTTSEKTMTTTPMKITTASATTTDNSSVKSTKVTSSISFPTKITTATISREITTQSVVDQANTGLPGGWIAFIVIAIVVVVGIILLVLYCKKRKKTANIDSVLYSNLRSQTCS